MLTVKGFCLMVFVWLFVMVVCLSFALLFYSYDAWCLSLLKTISSIVDVLSSVFFAVLLSLFFLFGLLCYLDLKLIFCLCFSFCF